MEKSKDLERIKKLYALSVNNSNTNEASLALKMARELCAKHNLTLTDVIAPQRSESYSRPSYSHSSSPAPSQEDIWQQRRRNFDERMNQRNQNYSDPKGRTDLSVTPNKLMFYSTCFFFCVVAILSHVIMG